MVRLTVKQTGTAVPNKVYIGSTHVPIQAAIDYAHSQGGGTIFIEHGIYLINNTANTDTNSKHGLVLYSNIKITGEYFGTILKPNWTDTAGSVVSCVGTAGNELTNIVIEALLIGNDDKNVAIGYYGIYCEYCGKAQTTGLENGGYDSSTVGKDKINKIGVTIKDCVVQRNSGFGIYLYYSSNNTVTGNTAQSSSFGIDLSSSSSTTVTGNTVQNNIYGIYIPTSSNNTITGNVTHNNGESGIDLGGSNNTLTGNTVQNNSGAGINLKSARNNTVTGNTVQNNSGTGIYLNNSNNNGTITGNTVQNNGSIGIYLYYSSNNTVTGNTVQNNSSGISLYDSSNNTITGNKYTSIYISGTSTGNLNAATHNQQIA